MKALLVVRSLVRPTRRLAGAAILLGAILPAGATLASPGYYRFPALHGEQVIFTAEGDLWEVPLAGGSARRLTTHPGEEIQGTISPDGRWIAFLGDHTGEVEAYVIPREGGVPKRVTFEGSLRLALSGWTPRGELLYATDDLPGPSSRATVLRAVDPHTLARRELPLVDANQGVFADEETLFFVRFGIHMTGDNARSYRGGAMAELWRFDVPSDQEATDQEEPYEEAVRLELASPASLQHPMWWGGRLWVASDRDSPDGTENLWSLAPDGSDWRRHTGQSSGHSSGLSVRSPTLATDGSGRIVYQLGADLRWLDLETGEDHEIPIRLISDFEQRRERWVASPLDFLTSAELAPGGDRVALTARGRVALAAPGARRRVEVPLPAESRAHSAVVSADGEWVYAIADTTGEPEIWRFAADGSGRAEALTNDAAGHRWRIHPSPDGKYLAHQDKGGRLWLLELASGRNEVIDQGAPFNSFEYQSVVWSPDSSAIALVRPATARQRAQVLLWTLADRRLEVLTSERYASYSPAFTPDGRWLYFLSDRHFQVTPGAPWGDRNTGPFFDRRTRIYALALQPLDLPDGKPERRFPFQPLDELAPTDKVAGEKPSEKPGDRVPPKKGAPAEDSDASLPPIVTAGLAERLYEVPLAAGNYSNLAADAQRLYFFDTDAASGSRAALKTLAISNDSPEPELFAADVADYALSADRKKLFLRKAAREGAGEMYLVDAGAKAPTDLSKARVRVDDWSLRLSPPQEWRQMFVDAWRMHRDFLYDPALRGVDWATVRARYEPLVERLTDRYELSDLLRQMNAELGVLHSQVGGGDLRRDPEAPAPAHLGARFEPAPGGLRIAHIWRSDPDLPGERSPLAQPGVDAREGDLLLAVNGRPVASLQDLAEQLLQQAGQQVLLELDRAGARRRTVVTPVASRREAALRYGDWIESRREHVEAVGTGRIGYLHLRAMGPGDIATFAREFYAQVDREGLIVDVRRNGGGNIDSWILEKLMRRPWAFWQAAGGPPYWNMQQSRRGHLVVLIDPLTYSDGETFAAGFRALGLGPLIGQRTAGAGVWLRDRNRLADSGIARVAEFAQFDLTGAFLIEGHGVAPDIEVDNPPHATWRGEDAQLDAAVAHLLRTLEERPVLPFQGGPLPKVQAP